MMEGNEEDGGVAKISTACGWMYEFCSRHGMQDAMQGIIQSMEKQFQMKIDTLFEYTDPLQVIHRLVCAGKLEDALERLELIPQGLNGAEGSTYISYNTAKNHVKMQLVLKHLRSQPRQFSDFKRAVGILFPPRPKRAASTNKNSIQQEDEMRARLQQLAKKESNEEVTSLLQSYPVEGMEAAVDAYVKEAKKLQPPTVLELVMQDVTQGKYAISSNAAAQSASSHKKAGQAASTAPPTSSTRSVEDESNIPSKKRAKASDSVAPRYRPSDYDSQSEARASSAADERAPDPAPLPLQGKRGTGTMLTAWEIRAILEGDDSDDAQQDMLRVHEGKHPDLVVFERQLAAKDAEEAAVHTSLPKRTGKKETQAKEKIEVETSGKDKIASKSPMTAKGEKVAQAKRKAEETDLTVQAVEENESQGSPVVGKRNKRPKRGGKENDAPAEDDDEVRKVNTNTGGTNKDVPSLGKEAAEAVRNLRDKSSNLKEKGSDPLEDARRMAGSVAPPTAASRAEGQERGSRLLKNAGPGEVVQFDEDDGEDETAVVRKLPSPQRLSIKPRLSNGAAPKQAPLLAHPNSPSKASTKVRWTEQEVTNLKQGVATYKEGNWSAILQNFQFNACRTNVDLKDKWRNLKKYDRI